jgi:hypothetical protein
MYMSFMSIVLLIVFKRPPARLSYSLASQAVRFNNLLYCPSDLGESLIR